MTMDPHEFERHVAAIRDARTNKTLKAAATEVLSALGYPRWIYASENPYGMLGLPATLANDYGTWIIKYMTKGYMKIDPVVAHCRQSAEPLCWGVDQAWEDEKQQAMMSDAAEHGFGSGIAIPLHLPDAPPGMINITSPAPLSETRGRFEELLPQLQRVGEALHAAMAMILKDNAQRAREREMDL